MGRVLCTHCDSGTSDSYRTCEWCGASLEEASFIVVGASTPAKLASPAEEAQARKEMLSRPPAPPRAEMFSRSSTPRREPIAYVSPPPPAVSEYKWGPRNPVLLCPHCGKIGGVHTAQVRRKKGVSGGKATAALLTAGLSIFATGLSRKEQETRAHCGYCNSTWHF